MESLIAILPILGVFLLLFEFRQSSLRAGIFAYIVTLLITIITSSFKLTSKGIFHATIKGMLISFIAAYVLFFGIFLFHLMNKSGKIDIIASCIAQATKDKIMQAIILVIGFSPLIESTSGFGTAFLVVTPILIALGFEHFKAALIGLVSLLAVPWGALSTGTVIGANLGKIPLENMGIGSAIVGIPTFIYFLAIAVYLAGGKKGVQEKWKEVILFSLTFGISILIFNAYVSVELAGVLSALITTGLGFIVVKLSYKKNKKYGNLAFNEISTSQEEVRESIFKVMSPYLFLTFFIFISRLIPAIKDFLESHFVIELPNYSFSLALLYSPGFWLLMACLFAIFIFRIQWLVIWDSLKETLKQWLPFVISTTAFVAMAEIMAESGMTMHIANIAGTLFGATFIFISPIIGGLGGFLTGSNTGANAMFINLQVQTAHQLGMSPDLFAYAQNTSASHSTMAAPSRVMLGASLCDIQSRENSLLKNICFIVAGALLIITLTTSLWLWLF